MTELRKKLRTISSKNKGLQDILRSCSEAVSIISVEKFISPVHNTKIVFGMPDGRKRIHFYNRVALENAIPEGFISSGILDLDIEILNSAHGCDFTEDDLEMVCGKFTAKVSSIGYYSEEGAGQGSNLPANEIEVPLGIYKESGDGYTIAIRITRLLPNDEKEELFFSSLASNESTGSHRPSDPFEIKTMIQNLNLPQWLELSYKDFEWVFDDTSIAGLICRLKNKSDTPIDIAILYFGIMFEGDFGEIVYTYPILSNARLMANGSTLPYCPLDDTKHLKKTDFVNWEEGAWDGTGIPLDDDDLPITYLGEDLAINGSKKQSWFNPRNLNVNMEIPPIPLNPVIDSPGKNGGLMGNVRMFVEEVGQWFYSVLNYKDYGRIPDDVVLSEDVPQMILVNAHSSPLMIEHRGILHPVQLTPNKMKTRPDEYFHHLGHQQSQYFKPRDILTIHTGDVGGAVNNLVASFSEEDFSSLRNDTMNKVMQNSEVKKYVELVIMRETSGLDVYLYARNISNKRVRIKLHYEYTAFEFILEPKGTVGVVADDALPGIEELLSETLHDELEEYEITHRGVTSNMLSGDVGMVSELLGMDTVSDTFWVQSPFVEIITAKYRKPGSALIEKQYALRPNPQGRVRSREIG